MEMFSGRDENREIREALRRALEDEIALCAHLERLPRKDHKGLERLRTIRRRISDLEGLLVTGSEIAPQQASALPAAKPSPPCIPRPVTEMPAVAERPKNLF